MPELTPPSSQVIVVSTFPDIFVMVRSGIKFMIMVVAMDTTMKSGDALQTATAYINFM